ncbi:MAG: hypothetical protein RIT38_434 [Bacteroidota bacterium]|jgi:hypothetical protein
MLKKRNFKGIILLTMIVFTLNHAQGQVTVTSNTTWSNSTIPSGASGGIIIQGCTLTIENVMGFSISNNITVDGTNAVLIIDNSHFIFTSNSAKIQVNKEGILQVINGSILEAPSPFTWEGINAAESDYHFSTAPTIDNSGNCSPAEWAGVLDGSATRIDVIGSFIRNAKHGIKSNASNDNTSAVVRARETEFKNCEFGVELSNNFCNRFPMQSGTYIMTCDFIWDNDMPNFEGFPSEYYIGIFLDNCKGINIGGCTFTDNISGNSPNSSMDFTSYGIYARKTTVNISKDGDRCEIANGDEDPCPDNSFSNPALSRGCSFNKLDLGVYYTTSNKNDKFAIRSSTFNDTKQGVMVGKTYNFAFGYNTYNFNTDAYINYYGPGPWFTGALIIHSYNGVGIYNNSFNYTHGGGTQQYIKFIEMGNLINHGLSYIKKNTFYNDIPLTTCGRNDNGIYIYGNNQALNIKCNTFENLAYDIKLTIDGKLSDIPLDGGGSTGAGNIYSDLHNLPCEYTNIAVPSGHLSNIGTVKYENTVPLNTPKQNIPVTIWEDINNYKSMGLANPCTATACEDLQVLAVRDVKKYQIVTTFPNPSSADFTITNKQLIKVVSLYSADGRKLLQVNSVSTLGNEFLVRKSDLNNYSGVILVKVECLNGQILTGRQIIY